MGLAFKRGYNGTGSVWKPCVPPDRSTPPVEERIAQTARTGGISDTQLHIGGCQNYGPFLGPCYNTAPII